MILVFHHCGQIIISNMEFLFSWVTNLYICIAQLENIPIKSYPAWWGRNHIRTNTILWADSFLCRTHFLAAAPSLPSSSWRQILVIIIMLMVMIMRWADELSKSFFCLNWRFFCTQILLIGFVCSSTALPRSQYRGEVKPQPNSGDLSISTQRCTSSFGVLASLWKSAFSRWISQFSLKNPTFFHAIYPPAASPTTTF